MRKFEEFYNSLTQEETITKQLEDAQQRKVIKSFRKLMKSECFVYWDKGLCEWCDEPFLDHECKCSGRNWHFLVMHDEVEDYVIALEFYDHDEPILVIDICEPIIVEENKSNVGVIEQEVVECVEQESLQHPLSMSQSFSTFSPNPSSLFHVSPTLSLLPHKTSSQYTHLLTNSQTLLLPIPFHKHNQAVFGESKNEWSAYFDLRNFIVGAIILWLFDSVGFESNNAANFVNDSTGVQENMVDQVFVANSIKVLLLCYLQVVVHPVKVVTDQQQREVCTKVAGHIKPAPKPHPLLLAGSSKISVKALMVKFAITHKRRKKSIMLQCKKDTNAGILIQLAAILQRRVIKSHNNAVFSIWGSKIMLCSSSVWKVWDYFLQVQNWSEVLLCEYLYLDVYVVFVFDPGGLWFNLFLLLLLLFLLLQ